MNDTTGYSPFFLETGRHPTLPANTLITTLTPTTTADTDAWAQKIVASLKRAFDHVREAQEQTSMKNKERDTRVRVDPGYKVGDLVYLWARSAEESRLCQAIREATGGRTKAKLSTKLTNPWIGPYPIVAISDNRHCVLWIEGKEVRHNVNRLTKQHQWDQWHADTAKAFEKSAKVAEKKYFSSSGSKETTATADKTNPIRAGQLIVFPINMTDNHPLPFALGRIIEIRDENDFKFQWLGNRSCLARGTFLPAWIDSKDNKYYYRNKPFHPTHQPYLGEHSDVTIGTADLIAHGFHILNESNRISQVVRELISKSIWVKQAWGDDTFSFTSSLE